MALTPHETLAYAVAAFASTNGPAYAEFMSALVSIQDKEMDGMVAAPPDVLQIAQGRVRGLRDLLKHLDISHARKVVQACEERKNR